MSALDGLKKFLHISPSVVFPEDVWQYVDEAEDEYDRLATEYAERDRECARLWDRIHTQDRQIEKLRELVRDMWRFTGTACKKYPRLFDPSAQGGQMVQLNQIDSFEQRIRELGIEVGT